MLEATTLIRHDVGPGTTARRAHGDTDPGRDEGRRLRTEPWFSGDQVDQGALTGQAASHQRSDDRVGVAKRQPTAN